MSEFTKGDTVRLKSGGPVMTIENIDAKSWASTADKDHAWCQWFEKTKLETGVFPLASLEKASRPSAGASAPSDRF